IFYSSIFAICTEAFVTRFIIDLKLFYLLILINFFILILFNRINISKELLICYTYLLFSGLLSVFLGSNHLSNFFAQLFGIIIFSLYYFNFYTFLEMKAVKIFAIYVYLSFVLAIIGYPLLLYNKLYGDML